MTYKPQILTAAEAGFGMLATVTGVNLKNTGQTTLYTVPTGKTLVITDIIPTVTTVDTVVVPPIIRIGKAAGYNQWLVLTTLTSFNALAQTMSLNTSAALAIRQIFSAGDVIAVDVQTAATATSLIASFDVLGYLK